MEKLNFNQAVTQMQEYLEKDLTDISSISITFYEDWAGVEHGYVLDTMTDVIKPRLFSLDTAHMIEPFELPSKDDLTDSIVKTEAKVAAEFKAAYEEMQAAMAEPVEEEEPELMEPLVDAEQPNE